MVMISGLTPYTLCLQPLRKCSITILILILRMKNHLEKGLAPFDNPEIHQCIGCYEGYRVWDPVVANLRMRQEVQLRLHQRNPPPVEEAFVRAGSIDEKELENTVSN